MLAATTAQGQLVTTPTAALTRTNRITSLPLPALKKLAWGPVSSVFVGALVRNVVEQPLEHLGDWQREVTPSMPTCND